MITDDNQGGSANVSPRVDFAHSKPRKKVPAYISSYKVLRCHPHYTSKYEIIKNILGVIYTHYASTLRF